MKTKLHNNTASIEIECVNRKNLNYKRNLKTFKKNIQEKMSNIEDRKDFDIWIIGVSEEENQNKGLEQMLKSIIQETFLLS